MLHQDAIFWGQQIFRFSKCSKSYKRFKAHLCSRPELEQILFSERFLGSMHFLLWNFNSFEWNPIFREVHPFPGTASSLLVHEHACGRADANFCSEPAFEQPFPRPFLKITMIWWYDPNMKTLKVGENEDHPMPSVDLWAIDQNASRPKLSNLQI